MGAEAFLHLAGRFAFERHRVSDRQSVEVDAFSRVADRLFDRHVEKIAVEPFRTHVPLYSLRAAAGGLGEEMESAAEDWVRAPKACGSTPEFSWRTWWDSRWNRAFPDGSLNLFRFNPVGSRQNKILLIQRFGVTDEAPATPSRSTPARKSRPARTSGATSAFAWSR
jgi:hypothetical protein